MLYIKHDNIGNTKQTVNIGSIFGIECYSRGIETGAYSPLMSLFKKLGKERKLSHWLAACAGDSAALEEFLDTIVHGKDLINGNRLADIRVLFAVELPCVGVMAVKASHRTSLEKDDEPNTGSVDCSEGFC